MKKNLYRGIRKDNGEWVYGSRFVGFKKSYICPEAIAMYNFDGALCLGGFVEVSPESVGQYTGLHDATKWENLPEKEQQEFLRIHKKEDWNGKKIFEGDIVKQTFEKAIREPFEYDLYGEDVGTVVIYGEDVGPVVLLPSKGVCIKNPISLRKTDGEVDISGKKLKMYKEVCSGRCEIIGNIHDNPELLLESKEECNT